MICSISGRCAATQHVRTCCGDGTQFYVAMGFFALIIMRRWRKLARRSAGLRRLLETRSVWTAFDHWKQAANLAAFQAFVERLAIRGALHSWREQVARHAAFDSAVQLHSRSLKAKVTEV